jgi:hypothetical protein
VFVVALVIRAWAASLVVFPKPEDTAYYVAVARNLVEGRGLISDALWSYQTPPLEVPRAAFEVWLPLPTFLAAIPMALFGTTFAAAQVSSVLVGAIVPVLAWRFAADAAAERAFSLERARTLSLGTGLTAAVYLPLVLHSALPDSTMPFAALALAACLLMTRIVREPRGASWRDARLIGLGLLIGLAAWTRNEAIWLGVTWLIVVATLAPGNSRAERARLVGVVAVVALIVFAPWAIRDWREFGTPLPGQALANALSVTGFDIFAWRDPPTLARYLAVGPARLLEMRVDGTLHNLLNVLLLLGVPLSAIGLVALPWSARLRSLRPLVLLSVLTFAFTSLVFPVSTTWGTFLHAAGPVHVLLVISCLLGTDSAMAWLSKRREWTRPVAWLGAALTLAASVLFSVVLMPSFGDGSRSTRDQYAALEAKMTAAGIALTPQTAVVTDFPIWLSEATGARSLALPDEPPADVVDLASTFGARTLVIQSTDEEGHGRWPAVLDDHSQASNCFRQMPLPPGPSPAADQAIGSMRVYRIVCP